MYRHYYRPRRSGTDRRAVLAATAGVVLVLAAHPGAWHKGHAGHHHPAAGNRAAAVAIAYAKSKLGDPYVWAATGPDAFDCSGLTQQAERAAGIVIERTSQQQWATLPHVPASQREPGDLVFAPGAPEPGAAPGPGHVAILVSRNAVIQAYATGHPIMRSSLAAFSAGAGGITGYARPGGVS